MSLDIVIGTQWGDEGKGRIVDLLAAHAAMCGALSTAAITPGTPSRWGRAPSSCT